MSGKDMNRKSTFSRVRFVVGILLACAMIALTTAALIEFHVLGLARRTFVFYAIDSEGIIIEERMLRRSGSTEGDIRRYVSEALLVPVSLEFLPLFPRGTQLQSLLYRNGVVYADLSGDAALPPLEGGEVFRNFETLRAGIKRNFSSVGEVRFFIDGRAAFATASR